MPRPGLRSKAQKRKKLKTPGTQTVSHYWRKKPSKAQCAICKKTLQAVPRLRPAKMKKQIRFPEEQIDLKAEGTVLNACKPY